ALRDCEAGWRGMLAERDMLVGQVGIQCTPGVEEYLSETVVPELSGAYPGIDLFIRPSTDMRQGFQSFLKSGCALGVGACVSEAWDAVRSQAEAAGLVCEFFGSESPRILLSARNPMAQGDTLSREQLGQLDLVCYSYAPPPRFLSLFRGQAARVPNTKSVVRLVANSEAAGVFPPSSVRRELSELKGRVRLLAPDFRDDAFLPVVHYLIHAPDDALPRPERCTLELIRHYPYTE
nr:hypothetical protein [Oscillospiraceae bacterium]